MEKINLQLEANTKQAQKNVDDLNKKVKDTGRSARKAGKDLSAGMQLGNAAVQGLDKYTGGLASKLLAVGKAAKLSGKAMKTALISTGIGALVVALGLVVQYWDDIVGLVDGVSSEQKDLLETTQKTLDVQEQQLKSTGQMENTLKLQGKSEKEIRDLKRQQTDEIITSTELLLEQQKSQKKAQVEAAERNNKITKGIITFLTAPIVLLLGMIDSLTYGLEKLGIVDEATNLAEGYVDGFAGMMFDPKEVEEKGDETITETENKLRQLKDKRDGYALQDKADAKKFADEKAQDEIDAEKAKAAAIESIRKALIDTEDEERAEKLRKIGEDYDEQIRLAEEYYGKDSEKVLELRAARKLAIDTQQATFDEQDRVEEQKRLDGIKAIQDQFKEQTEIEKLEEQEAKDIAELERLGATEEQIKALKLSYATQIANAEDTIEKEATEKKEKYAEDLESAKINLASQTLNILGSLAEEGSVLAKGVAVAGAIMNTYQGITKALAESTDPTPTQSFRFASAAAVGVMGFIQVANILKQKPVAKNASRPPSTGGGGGSAPTMESVPPAFNIVGASGTNQLADAIGGQTQQPTKAYVVASDVSTAQEMDRNIIEGASIG